MVNESSVFEPLKFYCICLNEDVLFHFVVSFLSYYVDVLVGSCFVSVAFSVSLFFMHPLKTYT